MDACWVRRGTYSLVTAVVSDPRPGEQVLLVSDPVDAASGALCHTCEDGADCHGGSAVIPTVRLSFVARLPVGPVFSLLPVGFSDSAVSRRWAGGGVEAWKRAM